VGEDRPRSYSQLTSFAECSYRYYLTRRRKVPTQQAVWFPAGTAFHKATERLDRDMFAGDTGLVRTGRQKLGHIWSDEFDRAVEDAREKEPDVSKWRTAGRPTADKPNGEDVDWWRTAGLNMVLGYADWWATNPPWRVWALPDGQPALETPLRMSFDGTIVVAYVDQILESTSDGRLLVVDKKTGRVKPYPPLQLATYSVELEAVFAQPFGWGSYFMARDGKLTEPEPLSHWSKEMLTEMFTRMDRAESQGLYLPNLGRHCSGCLVRQWCPPAGGQEYQEAA
jgi:putative RecB family exonuclease